jgi:Large polyvalent protein associated domain 23
MADYGKLVTRGLQAAGLGAAATVAAPDDAEAMFLGRTARGANLKMLDRAQRLAKEGSTPGYIHEATGWHQGPDKQWRYEIPDIESKFSFGKKPYIFGGEKFDINEAIAKANSIAQNLKHPELYKAYPELRNVRMFTYPESKFPDTAGFMRALPSGRGVLGLNETLRPDEARKVALHELMHRIQRIEGFAPGGGTADRPVVDAAARMVGVQPPEPGMGGLFRAWSDLQKFQEGKRALDQNYRRLAGEVEARNVEARSIYPEDQNFGFQRPSPWATQDIQDKYQIVLPPKDYQSELPLPYRR